MVINPWLMVINGDYPLVICDIAIENGWKWPIEIVDLPINSIVIFHSYQLVGGLEHEFYFPFH